MRIVENVFEIAESFMKSPRYVFMNNAKIDLLADTISQTEKPVFPFPDKGIEYFPAVVRELVAASINYCYWYGRDNVRPNGAGSTRMYELLANAFFDFKYASVDTFTKCINDFWKLMAIERFPMLEERRKHLDELVGSGMEFCIYVESGKYDLEYLLNEMVERFPGFASDIFLKRTSLFFIQLHRRFGWYSDELHNLHVPADYQVPKMIEHFGCTYYSSDLDNRIKSNIQIPKNSLEECEIRAATILTVKRFCELTGWNVSEIDSFFFLNRHSAEKPFHLTITTDY